MLDSDFVGEVESCHDGEFGVRVGSRYSSSVSKYVKGGFNAIIDNSAGWSFDRVGGAEFFRGVDDGLNM